MKTFTARLVAWAMLFSLCSTCSERVPGDASEVMDEDERVVLESNGWRLVGEWRAPPGSKPVPAVLLLHRAAGSRGEYAELARALAGRGLK